MNKKQLEDLRIAGLTGLDLSPGDPLCHAAYEEITALRSENERLREALSTISEATVTFEDNYEKVCDLRSIAYNALRSPVAETAASEPVPQDEKESK